jgi:hypothetical protein
MLYFVFNPDVVAVLVAHDIEQGEWVAQVRRPAGVAARVEERQAGRQAGRHTN